MKDNAKKFIKSIFNVAPQMFKYQIVTKFILLILITPIFTLLTDYLIENRGIEAINNSNIFSFVVSIQGLLFVILMLGLILITFLLEICGYITISSMFIRGQKESSFIDIFKSSLKISPRVLKGGIFLIIYLVIFIPLLGADIGLSLFSKLKIPNFIFSVIVSNKLYYTLYLISIFIILILTFNAIFTFHYIIILKQNSLEAIKSSFKLVKKNKKSLIISILFALFLIFILNFIVLFPFIFLLEIMKEIKIVYLILMIIIQILVLLLNFVLVPISLHLLTLMFYQYTKTNEYMSIKDKSKESLLDKVFKKKKTAIAFSFIVVVIMSIVLALNSAVITDYNPNMVVVAHRGGSENENTLIAIQRAIDKKVNYVEIDVQRTKDGKYILNHDVSFDRVAGVNKKPSEMTLEEIRSLNYPVPTLEEVFELTKNKIGVFVELKGETADAKMVDDVVKMVEEYGVKNQIILMSLDYEIIEYIEEKYPSFDSGYTCFLVFGDISKLKGDYLIIEEELANEKNIYDIHTAGKKVVVWTVNNDDSMDQFLKENVDGIITDYYDKLNEKIDIRNNKTDFERLIDSFK